MNRLWSLPENFTPPSQKTSGISCAFFFSYVFSRWKELLEKLEGFVSKNLSKIHMTILATKIHPLLVFN